MHPGTLFGVLTLEQHHAARDNLQPVTASQAARWHSDLGPSPLALAVAGWVTHQWPDMLPVISVDMNPAGRIDVTALPRYDRGAL